MEPFEHSYHAREARNRRTTRNSTGDVGCGFSPLTLAEGISHTITNRLRQAWCVAQLFVTDAGKSRERRALLTSEARPCKLF